MKPLIIFGIGKIAEVIHYYATEECGYSVVAFTVDKKFITKSEFLNKPVVNFSNIDAIYPPNKYDLFVAIGYHDLNKLREKKCKEALSKGYKLPNIISPEANIPKNSKVGYNCFIMPPALIHPCVNIGNNVFIWNGAMVGHHSTIDDNCWLTSCCNVSGNVTIGKNTFIAVNATIGHSVSIGKNCFIGANSLVTKQLDDEKVVISERSKPIRLNSELFLRMSDFSNL